jgi:hypothetical protein
MNVSILLVSIASARASFAWLFNVSGLIVLIGTVGFNDNTDRSVILWHLLTIFVEDPMSSK